MSGLNEEKQPTSVGAAVGVLWTGVDDDGDKENTSGTIRARRTPASWSGTLMIILKML